MVIIMLLITTVYHVKLTCKWVTEPLVFHCQAGLQIKMYWERLVICLLSWLCRFLFSFCVGLNGGQLASHLFLLEPSLFNMLSTSTPHCHFLKTCSSPVKIYKIRRIIPSQAYFIPTSYFCSTSLAILKTLMESFFSPKIWKAEARNFTYFSPSSNNIKLLNFWSIQVS